MKKFALTLVLMMTLALSGYAEDMTKVWENLKSKKEFIVSDIPAKKAKESGFETLSVALNSSPSSKDIQKVKKLTATINEDQKITEVTQHGVDVAVYGATASGDGTLYKVMFVIDKDDNADKALMVFYGTCLASNLNKALKKMSIEDLIGG